MLCAKPVFTSTTFSYADNILKGFAAAFSTMASCLLEVAFYGFKPTGAFLAGALLINVAAYTYNSPSAATLPPSPSNQRRALASKDPGNAV